MKTRIKPARRPRRVRPAAETVEAPDHRVTLRILPVMPVPPAPSSLARPTFPPLGPAAVPAIASGGVPPPPADDQPARHVDVVALSFALELLSELRSMHGLQLLIEMRAQAERGQRPMTLGEALEFMIYRRGLSPAGSKKVMRQLIRQNLLIPAHSPCIDKAKDLLAGRRLMHAFPIVARPYTVFRVSSEGELRRKKFDTAYLEPARLDPADVRLAEWLRLWRSQIRPGDDVPRSLTPFFSSDLNRRPSPSITGVISVLAPNPSDYEILLVDGPARADPAFMKCAQAIVIRRFKYRTWGRALKADCEQAKLTYMPLFHHLEGVMGNHPHNYFRLMLPFARDGANIDHVLTISELEKDRLPSPNGPFGARGEVPPNQPKRR